MLRTRSNGGLSLVVPQAPAKRVHTWAFLKAKKERNGPSFVGLAYQGKDIVLRFIIEYSSLRDFGP
jgi:hypothetical protein